MVLFFKPVQFSVFNTIKLIIAGKSNRKAAILFGIGVLIVKFFLLFPVLQGQNGYGNNSNYHRGQQARHFFR